MNLSTLQRVALGDEAAMEECLDRFGNLVWTVARRYSSTYADAEDATQDVFLELWKHACRFEPKLSSESTFIIVIARRKLIDRYRRAIRRPEMIELCDDCNQKAVDFTDHIEVEEEITRAKELMRKLDSRQKEVLKYLIFHSLSQAQTAKLLNLPFGTVKTLARRGLIRLRELLQKIPLSRSSAG